MAADSDFPAWARPLALERESVACGRAAIVLYWH